MNNTNTIFQSTKKDLDAIVEQYVSKAIVCHKNDIVFLDYLEDYCLYVKEGRFKLVLGNDSGQEKICYYIDTKGFSFMNTGPYLPAHLYGKLVADQKSILWCIPIEEFKKALQRPQALDLIIDGFQRRGSSLLGTLFYLSHNTSRGRVYHLISHLASQHGEHLEDGSIVIPYCPTRADFASLTGVHRANAITYLSELEDLGIIVKDKKQIIVKNDAALEKLILEEYEKK